MPDATIQPDDNAELRRSEEQLRLALDAGRMGTWDWDIRTNQLTWTGHLEVIHGFAPGTFPGSFEAFMAVVHPEDRERLGETINKALATRTHFEIEFRNPHPDGSLHWIGGRGRALYDEHGQPVRMIGIGYDLTARKHAEHSARFLAEASAALAELIDYESTLQMLATLAVPEFADWCAIDLVDDSGSLRRLAVAHVDPEKVRMAHELQAKYPSDPAAPHGVHHVIRTGQTELVSDVTEAMLRGAARDAEHERILLALGLRSYMCVPLALRGKTIGAVVFINAESGRRYTAADVALAEELARRASVAVDNARLYADLREADRRKDEFLAILAHELRNPLAPIGNGLRILRSGAPEARDRTHAIIERQFQHLVRLVDDLLDISRIRRGKIELRREAISLVAVVARAIEQTQPLFDAQRHVLSVHFPPEQLYVHVDPVRIAQVIANLLGNAAKYTDPGGRIGVEVSRAGDEAVVRVVDNGIGIPPDKLSQLFHMFMQVEPGGARGQGGLGIGLMLVRTLVELHGGHVAAFSAGPGEGSEFSVWLPLAPAPGLPLPPAPKPVVRQSRRILVVDDNVDAAETLALLLQSLQHEVTVRYGGLDALAAVDDFVPEIVILDIGMPGMDGLETARRMRTLPRGNEMLLVALTGWGGAEDRDRTAAAGFDAHLVKPIRLEDLQRLLG